METDPIAPEAAMRTMRNKDVYCDVAMSGSNSGPGITFDSGSSANLFLAKPA